MNRTTESVRMISRYGYECIRIWWESKTSSYRSSLYGQIFHSGLTIANHGCRTVLQPITAYESHERLRVKRPVKPTRSFDCRGQPNPQETKLPRVRPTRSSLLETAYPGHQVFPYVSKFMHCQTKSVVGWKLLTTYDQYWFIFYFDLLYLSTKFLPVPNPLGTGRFRITADTLASV